MNLPTMTATQAVTMRPNSTQSFLITIRAVEARQESKSQEAPAAPKSYPDDRLSERQKTLIFQLINQKFWDRKEREYELAKVAGFSKLDADAYIKSLINA